MPSYKKDSEEYKQIIQRERIEKLYHFTDRANLDSIIEAGGLYSWADCEARHITIPKPGSSDSSRSLDRRDNLQHFVRLSLCRNHPMKYVAKNDGRIDDPVLLEIDPEVIYWEKTLYADRNATKNGAHIGGDVDDFKQIHFSSVRASNQFNLPEEEKAFYQAEVLVKNFIPLEYILNIHNFRIQLPTQSLVSEIPHISEPPQIHEQPQHSQPTHQRPYRGQETRDTPTQSIDQPDQSIPTSRNTEEKVHIQPVRITTPPRFEHPLNSQARTPQKMKWWKIVIPILAVVLLVLSLIFSDEIKVLGYRCGANLGNATAQFELARYYDEGTQNYFEAVHWYRLAAEQGNADAQFYLGACYDYGLGVPQNHYEAVNWYRLAAEQGNNKAMCNLGVCYEYGKGGLTKDEVKAVEWYRKAAEAGDATAMCNLGNCYEYGKGGLTKDETKAVEWYRKAAEAGNSYAAGRLQKLGENHP